MTGNGTSPVQDVAAAARPPRRRGRPRAVPGPETGLSTREEIQQAAARLFGDQGYDATTTRQIAEEVGIKQATLYYHFRDKQAILRSLLASTVAPSVAFASWVLTQDASPAVRLCALVRLDLDGLLRDRWNLHVVYRLVGLGDDDYSEAHAQRTLLVERYRVLTSAAAEQHGIVGLPPAELDLVFGLVESSIGQRQWGAGTARGEYADAVVRGALRLVGVPAAEIAGTVAAAAALLAKADAVV